MMHKTTSKTLNYFKDALNYFNDAQNYFTETKWYQRNKKDTKPHPGEAERL